MAQSICLLMSTDGVHWENSYLWPTPRELLDRICTRVGSEKRVDDLAALFAACVNRTGVAIRDYPGVVYPEFVYFMPDESEYVTVRHKDGRATLRLRVEAMRVTPVVDRQQTTRRKRRDAC